MLCLFEKFPEKTHINSHSNRWFLSIPILFCCCCCCCPSNLIWHFEHIIWIWRFTIDLTMVCGLSVKISIKNISRNSLANFRQLISKKFQRLFILFTKFCVSQLKWRVFFGGGELRGSSHIIFCFFFNVIFQCLSGIHCFLHCIPKRPNGGQKTMLMLNWCRRLLGLLRRLPHTIENLNFQSQA